MWKVNIKTMWERLAPREYEKGLYSEAWRQYGRGISIESIWKRLI